MQDTQSILEQVRQLAAPLDIAGRLAMIRAIATLEPQPTGSEPQLDEIERELDAEQAAWFARPTADRRRFGDEFVAVRHGEVVDHDPDQRTLVMRVRARYGRVPLLIVPAKWDQTPVLNFRSPRLEQ